MGRFLTEVAGYANTPALLGGVELIDGDQKSAIAIVHAFVQNQGDAWTVTSAYLDRFVDEQRLLATTERPRKRGTGPLSALHVTNRQPRCRDACRARRAIMNLPNLRRSQPGLLMCPLGSRKSWSAPSTSSMP